MHGVAAVEARMVPMTATGILMLLLCIATSTARSADDKSAGEIGIAWPTESTDQSARSTNTCEASRMRCAFRVGCGMALQNYMVGCADVMSGRAPGGRCSEPCKRSLIALTSTDEGQQLMTCDCQGQEFCETTKARIEICRPEVMRANERHSVVSCSVAQWICAADPLCSTALEYYRRFCRGMFHGKKCTMRCNNSISILNRQEKASKLRSCVCDGSEDYDCETIMGNMDRLCFHKAPAGGATSQQRHHRNEIQGDSPAGDAASKSVQQRSGNACAHSSAAALLPTGNGRTGGWMSASGGVTLLLSVLFGLWHRTLVWRT